MRKRPPTCFTFVFLTCVIAIVVFWGATSALASSEAEGLWKWPAYKSPYSYIPSDYAYSVAVNPSNEVWVASGQGQGGGTLGGVSKFRREIPDYEKDNWDNYNATSGHLPDNFVYNVAFDASGNTWAATYQGVARFKGGSVPYWAHDSGDLYLSPTRYVAVNPVNGQVWVAKMTEFGDPAALYKYNGSSWTRYDGNPANPNYNPNGPQTWDINTIDFDLQGNVWIGTNGGGLSKFDGTNWTHYTIANSPLPSPIVEDITFDGSGNAWIATSTQLGGDGGAWKFNPATYDPVTNPGTHYGPDASDPANRRLADTDLKCITISVDGIWFGTRTRGAYLYNSAKPYSKQWRVFNPPNTEEGLANVCVTGVAYDNSGYIWFSTLSGGVGRLTADSIRNKPPKAAFKISPPYGDCSETTFTCDASQSSDSEDPLGALQVRWDWDASDGLNWDTDWTPVKIAEHFFGTSGKTITLQVKDTEGLTDSTTKNII